MDRLIKSEALAALYAILTEDKQALPSQSSLTRFERQLLASRVTTYVDVGDYLITTERRRYWTTPTPIDISRPYNEARSNASGLTPPFLPTPVICS